MREAVEYKAGDTVSINPKAMEVDIIYPFVLDGVECQAVKRADDSVDFYYVGSFATTNVRKGR